MNSFLDINLGHKKYPIYIRKGLIDELGTEIRKIYGGSKIAVITDENLNCLYGGRLFPALKAAGFEASSIVLPPGEKSKSFDTLLGIYDSLIDSGINRSHLIVVFGGGVAGDIGGFAASTYLRGIPYVQVPTSLLAQIDSSIGGKVAVDLKQGKNLVGSFYHPEAVFIDPELLKTLDKRFLYDGLAEAIKYGCIRDKKLFLALSDYDTIEELDEDMEYIIHSCCTIKKELVEKDEKDRGARMLLNFGHTIGHAIERYFNYEKYTHGEAVAIGMHMMTRLSEELGMTRAGTAEAIRNILCKYNLPHCIDIDDASKIFEGIKLDKKNVGDHINIVVLKEIGDAEVIKTSTDFIKEKFDFAAITRN